jgi:cyclophilin family peptidyl-prolyl cis-trans isomerase
MIYLPMKKLLLSLSLILLVTLTKAQSTFVRFVTNKGDITLMLYDETPKHRDMFLNCIKTGLYKNAEFNRVIKSFVSQGGESDDTILNREKRHAELGAKRFPAEIKPMLFHKKGALGAGRDDNPDKASYFTQIYLVVGKKQSDAQLDAIEQKKNRKIPEVQRTVYKTIGGTPNLDQDYTIFGEIVGGMEVADAINQAATDKNDVPLSAIVFNPVVLSKVEAAKLRQQLKHK